MSDGNSGATKNYSETLGTRLTPQTMDRFTEYREANELGKTEAARRLIRDALDDDTAEQRRPAAQLTVAFGALYTAVYAFGNQDTLVTIFGVYLLAMLVWSTSPRFRD